MLHLLCAGGYLLVSTTGVRDASGIAYHPSEIELEMADIPPELTGAEKEPAKVEKEEWVEGSAESADEPKDEKDPNLVSGEGSDKEGYLYYVKGDRPPLVILDFDPKEFFPAEARSANIKKQTVYVSIRIDEYGSLKGAHLASGEKGYGFDQAAMKVIKLARFRPGYRDGKAVRMNHTIAVQFLLD